MCINCYVWTTKIKSHYPTFTLRHSLSDTIKQRHIDYLAKPKKDGTQRKGGSLRHFEPSEEFKAERKNNWEIMFK